MIKNKNGPNRKEGTIRDSTLSALAQGLHLLNLKYNTMRAIALKILVNTFKAIFTDFLPLFQMARWITRRYYYLFEHSLKEFLKYSRKNILRTIKVPGGLPTT